MPFAADFSNRFQPTSSRDGKSGKVDAHPAVLGADDRQLSTDEAMAEGHDDSGRTNIAAAWWWPPDWFKHKDKNTDLHMPDGVNADVADGHRMKKVETEEDINGARYKGHAADAVHDLGRPSALGVQNAMQAVKDLGVDTSGKPLKVITDIPHDSWASPAAIQLNGQPTVLMPDQNVMKSIADQVKAKGGDAALREMHLDGKSFTDEIMPADVALHETEHLRQFASDAHNGPAKATGTDGQDTQYALMANPLEDQARETLHASDVVTGHGPTAITDGVEQESILEGMADTVSMTRTHDWKIGEGYFKDGNGAVRDINKTRAQDDFAGAFDDYRPVGGAIDAMRVAEKDFRTAIAEAKRVETEQPRTDADRQQQSDRIKHLKDVSDAAATKFSDASKPIKADGHLAGTIIPRTFRELQITAGWDKAQQLADAVGTDKALWTDPTFAKTVDSMRQRANDLDPSGELRKQVDAALATTNLADASTTSIAAPKPAPPQHDEPTPHGGHGRVYYI